jgi:hypothetical protein
MGGVEEFLVECTKWMDDIILEKMLDQILERKSTIRHASNESMQSPNSMGSFCPVRETG